MSAAAVPGALSDLASPDDPTILDVPTLEMKKKKKSEATHLLNGSTRIQT